MEETPKRRGPMLVELGPSQAAAAEAAEAVPGDAAGAAAGCARDRRVPRLSDPGAGPAPSPAEAAPVEDAPTPLPQPRGMELVGRILGGGPSRLTRLFLNSAAALVTFLVSVAALNFLSRLMQAHPLLGWIGIGLMALFCIATLAMGLREWRAWRRFAAIDGISREAAAALAVGDLAGARRVVGRLSALYRGRPEMGERLARVARHEGEAVDATSLIALAEAELLAGLDQEARREIEAAARMVAAATALIPLALADVAAATAGNLRMIRRMAEIYGGRAGSMGGWRLARTVMAHLVATGAVASGDDLVHTVAGGGILARVSKRFGEGVVNGALTARVGIAAMEVCRPLPFVHQPRPRVGNLLARGLKGLFGEEG